MERHGGLSEGASAGGPPTPGIRSPQQQHASPSPSSSRNGLHASPIKDDTKADINALQDMLSNVELDPPASPQPACDTIQAARSSGPEDALSPGTDRTGGSGYGGRASPSHGRGRGSGRRGGAPGGGRYAGGRGRVGPGGGAGGDAGRGGRGNYRRMWQRVTQVERGQKLGEAEDNRFMDVSVEELCKQIKDLAPEESAVEAVRHGLQYLDAGALAALLKELAKVGLVKRSMEIFDWIRSLDEHNDLYALADVFTYTTMIAQCGSHQYLRRALELVAEMRSRGIRCNVHTYSALMNVCIKANELDLAIDVYQQMLAEGCTPNVVTYNTLIDVYGKTGQWQEAIAVLDTLEQQGIEAEIRTFNTVIIACNMSGQASEAVRVYQRMLDAGLTPTATTYTALISAYGKNGKLDKAMEVFHDMVARKCERNVITYSSLISACEKASRWELALQLFDDMHAEGCKPNVVTYNALIAACAQGGQWEKALELFDQMQQRNCKPDAVTYGALLHALDMGGQWQRASVVFEDMRTAQCRPDGVVYNVVVGTLFRSGVVWAQARAVGLFTSAWRQGHFRLLVHQNPTTNSVEYSTNVFTVGAAVCSVWRWLGELKDRSLREGNKMVRMRVALVITRRKPGRDYAYAQIKEALTSLLTGHGCPLVINEVDSYWRVEGSMLPLLEWFGSAEYERLSQLGRRAQMLPPTPHPVLLADDEALAHRCADTLTSLQHTVDTLHVASSQLPHNYLVFRQTWLHLLWNYASAFGLTEAAVHHALGVLDLAMARGLSCSDQMMYLVVSCCLLLSASELNRVAQATGAPQLFPSAAAIEETLHVPLSTVESTQNEILALLGGDLGVVSWLHCLQVYCERLGLQQPLGAAYTDQHAVMSVAGESLVLCRVLLGEAPLLDYPPSLVAAALLTACRKVAGITPAWPLALEKLTGYAEGSPALGSVVQLVEGYIAKMRGAAVKDVGDMQPQHHMQQQQQYMQQQQQHAGGGVPSSPGGLHG